MLGNLQKTSNRALRVFVQSGMFAALQCSPVVCRLKITLQPLDMCTHRKQCIASSAVRQSNGLGATISLSGCSSNCSARMQPRPVAASCSTSPQADR